MNKSICILLAAICISTSAIAQNNPTADEEKAMKALAAADSGWTKKGGITIGITGSYFNLWAAGGINSGGINGLLNYGMNYRSGKHAWDNSLIVAYGMLNQGFTTSDSWVKTDDRFDFTSKYGRPINQKLFYAALLNFNTQFSAGYAPRGDGRPDRNAIISNFAAPARLLLSLGLDYKPNADISIFFSPATYRGIFVTDDLLAAQGAFGVEPGVIAIDSVTSKPYVRIAGATSRHEVGAYLRINYAKKFSDNFNLTSKLELFSNYLESPQNIDLAWETIGAWKIGKYFSFTTSLNFLYDDNTNVSKTGLRDDLDDVTGQPIIVNGSPLKEKYVFASKGLQTRIISTLGLTYNF